MMNRDFQFKKNDEETALETLYLLSGSVSSVERNGVFDKSSANSCQERL